MAAALAYFASRADSRQFGYRRAAARARRTLGESAITQILSARRRTKTGDGRTPGPGLPDPICRFSSYWKWKCEGCGYEFILTLVRIPEACHRCGGEWFLKVGEAA